MIRRVLEAVDQDGERYPPDLEGYTVGAFMREGDSAEAGLTPDQVDPEILAMGTDVEMEHTTNRAVAEKIALDHIAELGEAYYPALQEMEERLKSEGGT